MIKIPTILVRDMSRQPAIVIERWSTVGRGQRVHLFRWQWPYRPMSLCGFDLPESLMWTPPDAARCKTCEALSAPKFAPTVNERQS